MNLLYAYDDQEMVVEDLVHFVQLYFKKTNNTMTKKESRISILPSLFIPASRHRPIKIKCFQ